MSEVVLDASALLALVNDEPGARQVAKTLPHAALSAVNLAEVVSKLCEIGMPEDEIHSALDGLGINVHPFDSEMAYLTGTLRPLTRPHGLSLGDRACLALGLRLGLPVLTTDGAWESIKVGVRIRVVR